MNIVITGAKGSGKSTLGAALAELLELPAIQTDRAIEELYNSESDEARTFREIYKSIGEPRFREM